MTARRPLTIRDLIARINPGLTAAYTVCNRS